MLGRAVHQDSCRLPQSTINKVTEIEKWDPSRTQIVVGFFYPCEPAGARGACIVDKCSDEWWVKEGAG